MNMSEELRRRKGRYYRNTSLFILLDLGVALGVVWFGLSYPHLVTSQWYWVGAAAPFATALFLGVLMLNFWNRWDRRR